MAILNDDELLEDSIEGLEQLGIKRYRAVQLLTLDVMEDIVTQMWAEQEFMLSAIAEKELNVQNKS